MRPDQIGQAWWADAASNLNSILQFLSPKSSEPFELPALRLDRRDQKSNQVGSCTGGYRAQPEANPEPVSLTSLNPKLLLGKSNQVGSRTGGSHVQPEPNPTHASPRTLNLNPKLLLAFRQNRAEQQSSRKLRCRTSPATETQPGTPRS